jgi:hypothetical protein
MVIHNCGVDDGFVRVDGGDMVGLWWRVYSGRIVMGGWPMHAKGPAGVGCCRAYVSSVAATMAASVEECLGIGLCVGKNLTVSAIRAAPVLLT